MLESTPVAVSEGDATATISALSAGREKRLLVLYTDSGFGHVATTRALQAHLPNVRPWKLEATDVYREILTSLDPFKAITGMSGPDVYNEYALRRGHTRLLWPMIAASSSVAIRLGSRFVVKQLVAYFEQHSFDMVVSVMPLMNGAIAAALRRTGSKVPFVTIVTDFCEPMHAAWIQSPDQYMVCGTRKCSEQAKRFGLPESHILRSEGLVLSPKFAALKRRVTERDRLTARAALGLSPDKPVGLMLFGGRGADRMLDYAMAVESADLPVQMIYACGTNQELVSAIDALPMKRQRHVLGFSDVIERYMALSDFFVGKPGPGAISEAMVMGLPMALETGARLLAQERFNATWSTAIGAALAFRSTPELVETIGAIVEPARHVAMKRAIAAHPNTAIENLPDLLDAVFARHAAASRNETFFKNQRVVKNS